jgi:hypothetical protein
MTSGSASVGSRPRVAAARSIPARWRSPEPTPAQRQQASPNAVRGEQQGKGNEWQHIPGDIEDEFPQDRVDELIATRRFSDQY